MTVDAHVNSEPLETHQLMLIYSFRKIWTKRRKRIKAKRPNVGVPVPIQANRYYRKKNTKEEKERKKNQQKNNRNKSSVERFIDILCVHLKTNSKLSNCASLWVVFFLGTKTQTQNNVRTNVAAIKRLPQDNILRAEWITYSCNVCGVAIVVVAVLVVGRPMQYRL